VLESSLDDPRHPEEIYLCWEFAYSIIKELRRLVSSNSFQANLQFRRPSVNTGSGSQFRDSRKSQAAGGGEGTRTPDPMVANHVLCQLSYTPSFQNLKFRI
jgi:hypothetical protein